jgi:hypothetical protein
MRKKSLARNLGTAIAGLALGAFVALPAMAEPPSHGFHTHAPRPPHAPKPQHNPAPPPPGTHTSPQPPPVVIGPPPPHAPHAQHKPHPGLNPNGL